VGRLGPHPTDTCRGAVAFCVREAAGCLYLRAVPCPLPPSQTDLVPLTPTTPHTTPSTMLHYIIRITLGLTLAWLVLVALGVLLYTPHAPDVNVCNQELDWGSILSGFEKLKLEADYQVGRY